MKNIGNCDDDSEIPTVVERNEPGGVSHRSGDSLTYRGGTERFRERNERAQARLKMFPQR